MMNIFGVTIDERPKREMIRDAVRFIDGSEYRQIATLNPEMLLLARDDRKYRDILNACSMRIVDGIGIGLAFLMRGRRFSSRLTGVELSEALLSHLNEKTDAAVFLVSAKTGLGSWKKTARALSRKYPGVRFEGADIFPDSERQAGEVTEQLFNEPFDLVLCNFGAPNQETFLSGLRGGRARMGIGVGGAFDFWSGTIRRAPTVMRRLGLEWLWRLCMQPKRFGRIFRAVVVFPILLLLEFVWKSGKE